MKEDKPMAKAEQTITTIPGREDSQERLECQVMWQNGWEKRYSNTVKHT